MGKLIHLNSRRKVESRIKKWKIACVGLVFVVLIEHAVLFYLGYLNG